MKHILIVVAVLFVTASSILAQESKPNQTKQNPPAPQDLQWVRGNSGTTTESLGELTFPSRDTAYVSGYGHGRRSTDGGKTWSIMPQPEPIGVLFATNLIGYGITATSVYRTEDGGQSWKGPYSDSIPFVTSYTIVGPDTAFLICDGEIRRATDGGRTWLRPSHPNTSNLYGINFWKDSRTGVAVGAPLTGPANNQYGAACWTTTDGGNSWKQQYTGGPDDLHAVQYVTKNIILAAGSQGIIMRSTNGGESWIRIDTGVDHYRAIATTGKVSLLVGTGGEIRQSLDSGLTWTRIPSGIPTELDDVKMIDDTTAIIVGDKGVVLLSTDSGNEWTPITQPQSPLLVSVYPNPAQNQINLAYRLTEPNRITFTIASAEGKAIQTLVSNALQQAGPQSLTFSTTKLPSGNYFYHLTSERYNQSGSFTIIK